MTAPPLTALRVALLLACLAPAQARSQPLDAPGERVDEITVLPERSLYELKWRDAEDSLKGAVRPLDLREGSPLKVSLKVGSFYGAPFEGPVTLTLRAEGEKSGQTETVEPSEDGSWFATFVPRRPGRHTLDVGFRTTRYKALHARLDVAPSRLPRGLAWGLFGFIALLALGLGVFRVLKKPAQPRDPPLTT